MKGFFDKNFIRAFVVQTSTSILSKNRKKNMASREMHLYTYVKKLVQREDEEMNAFFLEYRERLPQITFQLKAETFSYCLQAIADELFETREKTYPYVMMLLAFSLKLDEYCKQYDWYNTELLIQSLVSILDKISFHPPNKYCVILYPKFFFLLLFQIRWGKRDT